MQMNVAGTVDRARVGEAASRAARRVYHTGQGQDKHAAEGSAWGQGRGPLHGLDSAWSWGGNPHRESGTRWRAAADVGQTSLEKQSSHGKPERRGGDRLGDSVGELGGMSMSPLGCLKDGSLIAFALDPHGVDDAHPHVGQGADGHTMGFAFRPFALVIGQRAGFLQRRLPGELVQGVAQGFQAGEAFVCFGIVATLERHRRGPGQGLDTGGISVAAAIIAPFGQQTWGQALARTRQRTPQLLIVMGQKKGADGLVIASNLLDHDQQLFDQREHQARLGTHDHLIGNQLGTVHLLEDLASTLRRIGMLARAQGRRNLCDGSGLRSLWGGIRLQKHESGALLHLGKQVQSGRIVLLEAGRQLVHQARLGLDQGVLIARERFQLLHDRAIRLQSAQLSQVKAAYLGQQMCVNLISLGSCGFAQLIGRLGVDRIDWDASFQQEGDEQSMVRFNNARQLFGRSRDAEHKLLQRIQPFVAMGKAPFSHALASFIQHLHIMVG